MFSIAADISLHERFCMSDQKVSSEVDLAFRSSPKACEGRRQFLCVICRSWKCMLIVRDALNDGFIRSHQAKYMSLNSCMLFSYLCITCICCECRPCSRLQPDKVALFVICKLLGFGKTCTMQCIAVWSISCIIKILLGMLVFFWGQICHYVINSQLKLD